MLPDFSSQREKEKYFRSLNEEQKPDVTLYEEFLPQRAYEESAALIRYADCLIIGGTSPEVGSAAQLAHMYHGKYPVIINKDRTKMEGKADPVFHDSIGKIMNMVEV